MRKSLFYILFLVNSTSFSQSVQPQIDSLESAILNTRRNTARVDILNQLAVLYYNIDIKKSLAQGDEALELARELEYDRGIQAAHSILRRVHRRLGNYSITIEYTLKNLPVLEQLKDTLELLDSYTTLGNTYSGMSNYEEALPFLFKAYAIGSSINSPHLANIMNYIGRTYGKLGEYDSALHYIQRALLRELANPQPGYGLSYIYNNLAEIYYYKKEYQKAIEFYNLSVGLSDDKKSQYGMTFTLNGLALVYKALNNPKKAVDCALKSIAIAESNTFREKAREAYGILFEIYQQQGNYKQALEYYKMYNLYQDSIYSEDRMKFIDNLRINYETERIKQENELLKKDAYFKDYQLKQQITLAWVSAITIALLIIISVLLYRINKQRRKTNKLLHAYNRDLESQVQDRTKDLTNTNDELIKQNSQLEQFGYITAHNLRAPVARILGLTNIIQTGHFTMPRDHEIINKLHFAADELDTIIHDLNNILDIKKGILSNYETVNLPNHLQKIKNILSEKIKETKATIIDNLDAPTCYAIPAYIESILYNLISNAIKYQSPDRSPIIKVSSAYINNHVLITITDNGIGIDLNKLKEKVFTLYQRFHHHVEGKGIGLYLVKTQVEALNGIIEIESNVNEGSTFKITIPNQPK